MGPLAHGPVDEPLCGLKVAGATQDRRSAHVPTQAFAGYDDLDWRALGLLPRSPKVRTDANHPQGPLSH